MVAALLPTDRVGVDAGRHDTAVAGPPHGSATAEGCGGGARRAFAGSPGAPPRRPPTRTRTARQRRRRSTIIITLVILLLGLLAGVGAWWLVSGRYCHGAERVGRIPLSGPVGAASRWVRPDRGDERIQREHRQGLGHPHRAAVGIGADPQPIDHLVVSSGKERFTIPDVHDQSQHDAQAALAKFPFQISVVQQTSDSVPNGNVIGTDPSAGTQVKRGQTVRLLVSSGPPIIEVPDVTGQSLDDATQTLTNAGFKVAVRQEISDDVDPGTVIDAATCGQRSCRQIQHGNDHRRAGLADHPSVAWRRRGRGQDPAAVARAQGEDAQALRRFPRASRRRQSVSRHPGAPRRHRHPRRHLSPSPSEVYAYSAVRATEYAY